MERTCFSSLRSKVPYCLLFTVFFITVICYSRNWLFLTLCCQNKQLSPSLPSASQIRPFAAKSINRAFRALQGNSNLFMERKSSAPSSIANCWRQCFDSMLVALCPFRRPESCQGHKTLYLRATKIGSLFHHRPMGQRIIKTRVGGMNFLSYRLIPPLYQICNSLGKIPRMSAKNLRLCFDIPLPFRSCKTPLQILAISRCQYLYSALTGCQGRIQ